MQFSNGKIKTIQPLRWLVLVFFSDLYSTYFTFQRMADGGAAFADARIILKLKIDEIIKFDEKYDSCFYLLIIVVNVQSEKIKSVYIEYIADSNTHTHY